MDRWERQVRTFAEERGWQFRGTTAAGHFKFEHPSVKGAMISTSKPGSYRNYLNTVTQFKRQERLHRIHTDKKQRGTKKTEPFERSPVDPRSGIQYANPCIVIRCQSCAEIAILRQRRKRDAAKGHEAAYTNRFRALGWFAGKSRSEDRCPECVGKPTIQKPKPIEAGPREAGLRALLDHRREVRQRQRRIFEAVARVYSRHCEGYIAGESDKTVAARLQHPVGDITKIRGEFFGAETTTSAASDFVAELEGLKRDCAALQAHTMADLEKIEARIANVLRRREILDKPSEPAQLAANPNGYGR